MDLSAFLEGVLDLPAFLDVSSVSVLACEPIKVNSLVVVAALAGHF